MHLQLDVHMRNRPNQRNLYLGHPHCCSEFVVPVLHLRPTFGLHLQGCHHHHHHCLHISLTLCFLPIVVGIQILKENVVLIPADKI
jgi:hypothetical protein